MILRLGADTGRRIGAILGLPWGDWLPSEGASGALVWRAETDKLRRPTTIPVSPAVAAELEIERERPGGRSGRTRCYSPPPTDETSLVSFQVATDWLRRAEKLAGLERVSGIL